MAGGHGSPVEKLRNLSKTELLLHKVAMNRIKHPSCKQALERKSSTVNPGREFVLEEYKLKNRVDQLEKEKQHCIHRYREDAHMFRMSVKLPPQCGQEYWSQYGEKFHANGEYRENNVFLRLPPQPSPRQQPKTKKERYSSVDISKGYNSRPCKTVADLVTIMRREATPLLANEAPNICPLSSSSKAGNSSTHNVSTVKSESLEKLRVLLENYEVFVPSEDEREISQEDTGLGDDVEENKNCQQSRSVDDIEKVELRVSRGMVERLMRSQSAQTNHVPQRQTRFRKRHSVPNTSRGIAEGALRVHALQPRACKYGDKSYRSSKNPNTFFCRSPSRRILLKSESTSSLHKSRKQKDIDGDVRIPTDIGIRKNNKESRSESRFKIGRAGNFSSEDWKNGGEIRQSRKVFKDKENGGSPEETEIVNHNMKESLGDITYCFDDGNYFYNNMDVTERPKRDVKGGRASCSARLITPSPIYRHVSTRYIPRENKTKYSSSKQLSFGSPASGKLSIKNLIPEFPVDIKALRQASEESTRSVSDDTTTGRREHHWRPKPKTMVRSSGQKGLASTSYNLEKEVDERQCYLAHVAMKATKKTAMMVLGKGMLDKKKQDKQTREKMDQFFARLDSTNGQTSAVNTAAPTRPNTATLIAKERRMKKQEYQKKTEKMYKRATPWPVQVWC